jgi:cyclic pyranopterin monophosphate synthase
MLTSVFSYWKAIIELPPEVVSLISVDSRDTGARGTQRYEIFGTKGPVFSTAIVAGVMAAKKTSELIPFCHPVGLEDCSITVEFEKPVVGSDKVHNTLVIDCLVRTTNKTGVEMEAMVGATNTALCIYDMLKAASHNIVISKVMLIAKAGGKSTFHREACR